MTIKTCSLHGEYESGAYTIFGQQIESICPQCDAENKARLQKEYDATERRERLARWIDDIPIALRSMTLENFNAYNESLAVKKSKVSEFIQGKIQSLIMVGPPGTGKTHLAAAAINELGGIIKTAYIISATIRDSYGRPEKKSEVEIIRELTTCPLLVIDEIGRTKGSDAELNWLSYVIDTRHNEQRQTILISNKHILSDCLKRGCQDCVENYLGSDIISRMSSNGLIMRFTGEDYRKRDLTL